MDQQDKYDFQVSNVTYWVRKRKPGTTPPDNWIKCNVDESFISSQTKATIGWVVRDGRGRYQGAVQAKGYKVCSHLESELQSILMAI